MKKLLLSIILILVIVLGITIYKNNKQEDNTIYIQAAASMKSALDEVISTIDQSKYDIVVNYGGSGTLVNQIQQGAPCDIFISASEDHFKSLEQTNKMVEKNNFLSNTLVLIENKDNQFRDIENINKIAVGTPDVVPAGNYAIQTLKSLNLYDKVSDKLVYTKDVSEVLTYVESNNVDYGFVYKTDALKSAKVNIVQEIDNNLHDEIIYPIGLLSSSKNAKEIYDQIISSQSKDTFMKYGFTIYE